MHKIEQYRKAVAAFLVPALVVLVSAMQDSSDHGSVVSNAEWLTAVIAALSSSLVVGAVRNGPSNDPTTSTPEVDAGLL